MSTGRRRYTVREFAKTAGVTVRALHHYDRLGLLVPKRNAKTGYRAYEDEDFVRLEQIVVLKSLGLPLIEIGRTLKKDGTLLDALKLQRRVLVEKRRRLELAVAAIESAERSIAAGETAVWPLFIKIVKEIEMADADWTAKYYSEEAKAAVNARRPAWSPELQERVSREWAELIADVESAIARKEDPASGVSIALAARWKALLEGFTGGDPDIQRGLNRMWADRENWPDGPARSFRMPAAVPEFIARVMQGGRSMP